MLTNTDLTIYHKTINSTTKLEEYRRQYFKKCWAFYNESSNIDKGYGKRNLIEIRIPLLDNPRVFDAEIVIGDIIYVGRGPYEITKQKDLANSFNVTSVTKNRFGNKPHVHIGGK